MLMVEFGKLFSQVLAEQQLNQEIFDLSELNTGIYVIELTKDGGSAFQKIIIE